MVKKETWVHHKICIEILTPVIIQTGEVFAYGELFLNDKNKLFKININNLLKLMDKKDQTAYIDAVMKGIETREVKYDHSARDIVEHTIQMHPDKITRIISRPMGLLPSAEKFLRAKPFLEIDKNCVKKLNEKPYIPGSSLKGAIRTAFIQSLLNKKNNVSESDYIDERQDRLRYQKTRYFESNVMDVSSNVTEDPFKYIKVSDLEFDDNRINNYLGEVLMSTKQNPLPVYTAMSDAFCLHHKKITLTGTISLSSRLNSIRSLSPFTSFSSIIDALNDFYIDNFNRKSDKLPVVSRNSMSKIISDNISVERGLIKLGRFSGIENVTYNLIQNESINKKIYNEKINIEGGKSYPLIEHKYLPGYCILSEVKE